LVGTPTAAKTVSVTNNANAAIAFTSVAISAGAPVAANTDFTSPANTCGTNIAAGASCTVSVVYTPSGTAAETANLVVTDADATSPQTVTLSGTGTTTAPSFSVSAAPASLTVAQGASGTFTVTVTPAGGFNQAVALACSGTPTMSTCSVAPTSVTPTDGTTPVTAMVTVATTSPSVVAPPSSTPNPPLSLWRLLSLTLALLLLFLLMRSQKLAARLSMGAAMVAFLALAGCGGGKPTRVPTGGTPKGASTLTVTGASGTLTSSATVSLTVN
jgi:trimeric autotransporter adhesin